MKDIEPHIDKGLIKKNRPKPTHCFRLYYRLVDAMREDDYVSVGCQAERDRVRGVIRDKTTGQEYEVVIKPMKEGK